MLIRYAKSGLEILSTLAVIVAAGALLWTLFNQTSRPSAVSAQPPVADVDARIDPNMIRNVQGKGETAIVEFGDFQCPFCARNARETLPAIEEKLIATGAVRYVFFNFPLEAIHPFARKASEAAECAGDQGKYWGMHRRLFDNPNALAASDLTTHALALGLDEQRFTACLNGGAAARVDADMELGQKLQVAATPTMFIGKVDENGGIQLVKRINGATTLDSITAALDGI